MKNSSVTLEVAGAFVVLPLDKQGFAQWPIELFVDGDLKATFFDVEKAHQSAKEWFEHQEYSTVSLDRECIERGMDPNDDSIGTENIMYLQLPGFESPQDALYYLTNQPEKITL